MVPKLTPSMCMLTLVIFYRIQIVHNLWLASSLSAGSCSEQIVATSSSSCVLIGAWLLSRLFIQWITQPSTMQYLGGRRPQQT